MQTQQAKPGTSATEATDHSRSLTLTREPLGLFDTQSFNREWLRCREWIQDALDRTRGFYTEFDVLKRLIEGKAQFWPGRESAIVTQITPQQNFQVLWFFLAGGKLEELRDEMQPACIDWAKRNYDVKYAMFGGRAGWLRALGYEEYSRTGIKEV